LKLAKFGEQNKLTNLDRAVILLTGASGGFGEEFIKQLLQANSRLILSDRDCEINCEIIQEKVAIIRKEITTGEIISCLAADLSDRNGRELLYNRVKALNVPVDILINNAGIGLFGRMDEVPTDKWEQLMQVNLLAPMALSALFAREMIVRQQGHIVNISSLAGWFAPKGLAHYSASKFGLRGFSEGLFNEVKPYNVKVTAVYPYFSRTPILNSPQYGTLAQTNGSFLVRSVTNPADVIRETLKAIIRDRPAVFPDATAKQVSFLKRHFPKLFDWLVSR
jgi:short-subunit dehydrogenase